MTENNNNDILEAIQTLSTHMDEQIGDVRREIGGVREDLGGQIGKLRSDLDDTRKDLGGQIGKPRSDLIDHVTRTVSTAQGDIMQSIKTDRERHKLFHEKLLSIFERSKIAKPEEVAVLRELVV